ncbi:PilN domain-containing protein [Ewingella americana]
MLQVNLLPWRGLQQRRQQRFWLRQTTLLFMLAVALMSVWMVITQRSVRAMESDVQTLADSQTRLTRQLEKVHDATLQLQGLQRAASQREQRRMKSLGYLALLRSIAGNIPDRVWLTEITEEPDGDLQLRGESGVYQAIMTFAEALKDDALFTEVRLLDIQRLPAQSLGFGVRVRLSGSRNIL